MMAQFLRFALLFLVAACAEAPPGEPAGKSPPLNFSLSPASLGRSLSMSQLVTGAFGGKTHRMRYEVEITPARLVIVGLSPAGIVLFTLVQQRGKVSVETELKDIAALDPRYALVDLYLAYWPRDVLQAALLPLRIRLDETADGSVRRAWAEDGTLIAEIVYRRRNSRRGEIVIRRFGPDYRLQIQTLETGRAP